MNIALFLPHVGVFGGVRRYLELGNEWTAAGHAVTLHHPAGTPPGWLPFAGRTATLDAARATESDVAIGGDAGTYTALRTHRSRRHVYYCVLEGDPGLPAAIADRSVTLMANSGPLRHQLERRAHRKVLDGAGGIRTERFRPAPALRARGARLRLRARVHAQRHHQLRAPRRERARPLAEPLVAARRHPPTARRRAAARSARGRGAGERGAVGVGAARREHPRAARAGVSPLRRAPQRFGR